MTQGKVLLLASLIGFLSSAALCQSRVTDSLEQLLDKSKGTEKVDILNQLTYEYITRDNQKVINYGKQAIELSKKINYKKGEAKAYTYKGVYEYSSGQFPEAHRDLHHGLSLSKVAGDRTLHGYTLLQLGVCSLEEVQNDSALLFFKKSYEIFKDSTDPTTLSKLYRNISALYGQRYQPDSQRIYLDRAIRIRRLLPSKVLLVDALVLKANITLRLGDFSGAEVLLNEAESFLKKYPDAEENRNDIFHLRALILFQKGKFDEAVVLFDSARNYYFRMTLLRKYVTLLADMGKVFSDRGEYELALNNLYDGLKLSELRGFNVETSIIRHRIGWVNYRLGDLDQALRLANEAMKAGPQKPMQGDLASALTLKGVVLTDLNDFKHARPCLDSVLDIYRGLGNQQGVSEALMNLGNLEEKRGKYDEALRLYKESVRLAETIPFNYGLAWSFWGMGDIYFKLGDYKNSAHFLDQSQQYARLVGSKEVLILNFNTRRDLLAAQNRFEESLQYAIRASQLKDSIHRTDVARRFVNLERIQEIQERDRNILGLQKDRQLAEDRIHLQDAKLKQQSILLLAGVISLALLAVLAFVYYRFYSQIKVLNVDVTDKNTRIQAQSNKLQEVNLELKHLYQEVSEQKEKIQAQADKLTEKNRSISDMNRSLEKIVTEKTLELRKTNDELVKHNGELLQFSYTVSHNLRGPVARLLGLSDLALRENSVDEAKQWISLISKTTSELDLIIKDLSKILDLTNEPNQYREVVGLEKEWSQSRSLLQDSLNGTEEITTHFESLPEITTVRAMLQSIFYNLLSNAIKYRSPERKLKITAVSRSENGNAILEIMDNGLGFDTELHKEKLFKLYKRFHTHVEGRGLGLYLIKSQVEVLHGEIEVDSQPGRGSLFRIILPLKAEEHTAEYREVSA
ncbi:MAG: tetratricopeptide repeat protein [Chryseolinea sp.]